MFYWKRLVKTFYWKKDLLEKSAGMKRFEYSLWGSELRKQTSVAEKKHQKLDKVFQCNKKEKDKTKKYSCSEPPTFKRGICRLRFY